MKQLFLTPTHEVSIDNALFLNQDITVYPVDRPWPDNITEVIKFLFGEGAYLRQDAETSARHGLIIKGASYMLKGAKTLNPAWTLREVRNEID